MGDIEIMSGSVVSSYDSVRHPGHTGHFFDIMHAYDIGAVGDADGHRGGGAFHPFLAGGDPPRTWLIVDFREVPSSTGCP